MRRKIERSETGALALDETGPGAVVLRLSGALDAAGVARLWTPALEAARRPDLRELRVELSGSEYVDGAGLALLVALEAAARGSGARFALAGLPERYAPLLALAEKAAPTASPGRPVRVFGVREWRKILADLRAVVAFIGECSLVVWRSLTHPRSVRWGDVLHSAVAIGVESLPILLLIGFLMGLIMSFQSVITLERFGGEIYVPNMLGLVMFREMGPLVTAILLASRSGSAFAAEIGTMRVNEELDALSTMGISPVRFLVGPRILSALAVVPIMTIIFNFASLIGGALVMLSIGFPLVTFTSRVFANVHYTELFGSLFKIIVFSLLVAGVSCLHGLRTGGGASAVGRSTTSAVVSGLVLITVADGLFAVLFYYFKI